MSQTEQNSFPQHSIAGFPCSGIAGKFVVFEDAFDQSVVAQLLETTRNNRELLLNPQAPHDGSPSANSGDLQNYRIDNYKFELLRERLRQLLDPVCEFLYIPHFKIGKFGMTMAAHLDGGCLPTHRDLSDFPHHTFLRTVTYVYYYFATPPRFTGGNLILYDRDLKKVCQDSANIVQPKSNSIVFFPSQLYHEVTPVNLPGNDFNYARFALRGSFHRRNIPLSVIQSLNQQCPSSLLSIKRLVFNKLNPWI
jgi:Rps23 Pro-64 3,4-dihydroxylase Tpa1-like proline 4-hydroxylase